MSTAWCSVTSTSSQSSTSFSLVVGIFFLRVFFTLNGTMTVSCTTFFTHTSLSRTSARCSVIVYSSSTSFQSGT